MSHLDKLTIITDQYADYALAYMNSAPDAIIGSNPEGRIVVWNAAAEKLFGYQADEVLGRRFSMMFPASAMDEFERILAIARKGNIVNRYETVRRRKDGSLVDVAVQMSPVRGPLGEDLGNAAILEDLTSQRKSDQREREFSDSLVYASTVMDAAPTPIIATDLDGLITKWNRAAETTFGYSAEEAIGRSIELIIPEHSLPLTNIALEKAKQGIKVQRYEVQRMRKDGVLIDLSISMAPVRNSVGELIGTVGVLVDISERKRNEDLLNQVIEYSPIAKILVGLDRKIKMVNLKAVEIFGYSYEEMLGQDIEMLIPARFRKKHAQSISDYHKSPTTRKMGAERDLYALRKDQSEMRVESNLSHLHTSKGNFTLLSVVDITPRVRAEEALKARTQELLRSNQDLEQFAYAASHDLQEPLRAVTGCVQLLRDQYKGKLDARADEFIHHTIDGVERMRLLIEGLLAYSRLGRANLPAEPVSLDLVLDTALLNLNTAINASQATIRREPLPMVRGISVQLTMLFQNLLGNAIKFQKPAVKPEINICTKELDGHYEISIEDNGIGIEAQYADRIFIIFQRLHTRTEYEGAGIGLALSKRILDRHGGSIWVEPSPSGGSIFRFRIPLYANPMH